MLKLSTPAQRLSACDKKRPTVYISGSNSTDVGRYDLEELSEVCRRLELDTFLPHRDIIDDDRYSEDEYIRRLRSLEEADAVVTLLKPGDDDSDSSWETGYAIARLKTVIGLCRGDPKQWLQIMTEHSVHCVRTIPELEHILRVCFRHPTYGKSE